MPRGILDVTAPVAATLHQRAPHATFLSSQRLGCHLPEETKGRLSRELPQGELPISPEATAILDAQTENTANPLPSD